MSNLQVANTELKEAIEAHESCTVTKYVSVAVDVDGGFDSVDGTIPIGGNALWTLHGELRCDACDVTVVEFYEDEKGASDE